jgi:hypothetical protein
METSKITGLHGIACEIESATARRAFERDNCRNQADCTRLRLLFAYEHGMCALLGRDFERNRDVSPLETTV